MTQNTGSLPRIMSRTVPPPKSVSIAPGVSTLAFWVAQQILDGKEVKKDLVVPFLRIDQDNLEANLANTQAGGVANVEYSLEDAQKVIASAK